MLNQFIKDHTAEERLRSGPLGPHLDSFGELAGGLGYSFSSTRQQFGFISDLSRWLEKKQLVAADLDEQTADVFLDSRRRQRRFDRSLSSTVRRFVGHLRAEGVIPPLPEPATDRSALVHLKRRYEDYLRKERGLVSATVDGYLPFIQSFLDERFGGGPLSLAELEPSDVASFVIRHADSMSRGRAKQMVTALRSFLRFIFQYGETETNLADCVPAVAQWRLSTVPKYLPREQVEQVLAACDLSTMIGRRDYAILLLLARLGLRAGEIVRLQLEDIDWRRGEITVRGKGLVQDRLPLLPDVGESLVTYLRQDRPETANTRCVFVCTRAPLRGFAGPATVSTIVRCAIERAGLNPPIKGAHLLRHSLATGMLRSGASLAEIGEVLRHRSSNTTEIYAKVDFTALRSVAQRWPGTGGGL